MIETAYFKNRALCTLYVKSMYTAILENSWSLFSQKAIFSAEEGFSSFSAIFVEKMQKCKKVRFSQKCRFCDFVKFLGSDLKILEELIHVSESCFSKMTVFANFAFFALFAISQYFAIFALFHDFDVFRPQDPIFWVPGR